MTLPPDFMERTRALLGADFERLVDALRQPPPVSIRLNSRKPAPMPEARVIPWCSAGRYLPSRPSFTFDPLFHAGAYYVQEAASMFVAQAVRTYIDTPVRCLDLCAAPGGKATLLSDTLPEGSLLVANEVIRSRAQILAENMTKWGNPSTIVTSADPKEFAALPAFFDVVVADLPCSGEGMFRKDAASIRQWSVENVRLCQSRQRRIIHDVWDTLKPGGLLLYSTCTYNLEENEENIHYIIEEFGAEPLPIPAEKEWGITGPLHYDAPVSRFFPHRTEGEGFFLAVLRKPETAVPSPSNKRKKGKGLRPNPVPPEAIHWLSNPADFHIEMVNNTIQAVPLSCREEYRLIANRLKIISAGITLGELKGKTIIPAHALAMSTAINRAAFEQAAVDRETAIRYLRKEAIILPAETPLNYILLTYQDMPLGFVKNIGNRANNLYPQEWRIRTNPNVMTKA